MANVLHLSKLSRGHVELSDTGSRLEIYADQNEKPLIHTSGTNQLPHIPKTYSTKRGPLVLFAETGFIKHSRSKSYRDKRLLHHDFNSPSLISPPPLKIGELKRSILAYGGTPENQFADGVVDEDGTYINMKIPSKKRPHPSKYAGISPNIAIKRRYMIASSEDKKRELDSILELEYSASRNQRYSMMKTHVLSDEISLLPPVYRNPDIAQHSPSFLADTYRFFQIENSISSNDCENTEQVNPETQNTLEIVDSKGSCLSYDKLEQSEKEKVLTDLLIQTALHNIAEQQNIEIFEDALNRVRDSDITQSFSTMDIPILVDDSTLSAFPTDTLSNHNQNLKSTSSSNTSPSQQHYMFGKMLGSKWARNRPSHSNTLPTKSKHQTNNGEQQNDSTNTDEFNNEYTQTASDFVHTKLIHASRLLAPISTSAHQESSTIRNQHHTTTKLSTRLRKFHDLDSNQHKISTKLTHRYRNHTQIKHLSSPAESQQDTLTATNQLIEKEQTFTNSFYRQRSSKSSKLNPSRQGTGKTFATGRCVTSPLSIHEEAERLLAIDSSKEEDDNDNNESTRTSIVDAVEDALVRNASQSPGTKTDEEHDQHVHPSEMNLTETSIIPPEVHAQRSAYTHRSHVTLKSKHSSVVPPGALLIAPDGEILFVGGPSGHPDNDDDDYLSKQEPFAHQPSTNSLVIENNDQQGVSVAPCVPMVLGTKRERLPDETVIRRTLNLTGGDFNSQIGLQSWSYEVPLERRQIVSQSYTLIPPPPPIGLSAFTGRKHHHQKRTAQEIQDHAVLHSTLSMHTEAIQQQRIGIQSNNKTRPVTESQSPLFAFTSWAYQRPPTPPMIKRPYLYKPDYRPSGVHGHKHPIGDTETLIRRTINIHAGDIDASLSFTIWVYDMWINDLVKSGADPHYVKQIKSLFDLFKQRRLSKVDLKDKEFLTALANHAQALARIILKRSNSGYHLAEDAQLAIIENLRNLKYLLDQRLASVSDDEYREILRETLQHVLNKGNLENLQITDEVLMALVDYPIEAFEIYLDPDTGDEYIRIKSAYQTRKNKIKPKRPKKKTKTVIISEEISPDDFERMIDEKTGEYVYRLKKSVAEQKGFMDLIETNFDIITDKKTGERIIKIKNLPNNINFTVEIVFDPDTGKQILILKKEVSKTPPIIQSDITIEDFELVTDENTGETVLRLKADIAARKGLTSLGKTNFEVVVDPTTGQKIIRIKDDGTNQMNGNRIEIITDAITGKQTIRMIADDDNDESNEPIVTITENDIDLNDFERIIDPLTGREILRMKADVLKAKGLEELANAEFEIVVDAVTGQSRIVLKTPSSDFSSGTNTNFEIIVDIVTGKQKIIKRTVTEQEKDNVDIIESQLNVDDFERVIDPDTGLEVLRLKKGAAARKGLTDLLDVQFEMVTDANGKQTIVIKGGGNQGNAGDAKFELITDASGRTTIKIRKERPPTPELEVTEKSIDINDFEEVIDSKTGMKVLKLKVDVAKRAGMMELLDAQFETYIDEKTGKQAIRIKQTDGGNGPDDVKFEIITDASGKQVLRMVQEIPKTIEVTNVDVNANDFEEVIDAKTGKKVLRMKKEVAKRKGFVDMDNVDFEFVIDQKTGQQVIQIKGGTGKITKGNKTFEMVIDPKTGQQTLRMKQEVEVQFETIENDLVNEDFEEFIDEITGERILKLTAEAAARKGLNDLRDVEFEIYKDPTTGKEEIRMKGGNQTGKLDGDQKFEIYIDKKTGLPKIVLKRPKGRTPPPVEASIDVNDFEKFTDPVTGKEFYRLTDEAVRRKGLANVKDMEFDIEIDETTGKTVMKPKVNSIAGQKVEIVIDPQTGEQTIRIIPQKTIERMATITTSIDLDEDAFTIQIDPITGKEIISLSKDLMENYGLENIEFEQVVDETTGQTVYRMKPVIGKDGKVYELITDPTTGKQSLQVKETVTQEQLTTIIASREAKGLRIPRAASGHTRISGVTNEERNFLPTGISTRTKKKLGVALSPDDDMATSPTDSFTNGNRRQSQAGLKPRPVRVKSPSGQQDDIDWTSDDEKELDGLSVYEQRRRKEQMIAEKKRKVAEMKRQQELAIQNRLKKQRESLVDIIDHTSGLLNDEDQDRIAQWERDLRKLDGERDGLTDEEYQERRKKLFAERTRVLKAAYDRKMDRLKRQTGIPDGGRVDGEKAAELEAQIRAEEDLLLSMMNPEEREDYIRARNEERARQRLLTERERMKREEELQTALAETKRMAAIRAAEIMAKELQKRSNNSMYAELKDLVTEQKVSRAFTYSYFSLLQFLASSRPNSAN